MELNSKAELYIPQSSKGGECDFLAVAAHQDDIEIMAIDGILRGWKENNKGFVGVITTDGGGSPREGKYKNYTYEDMKKVRNKEQKQASEIGCYSALVSLNHTSKQVKDSSDRGIIEDYKEILKKYKPKVVYTHNLCDKHDTHVGVAVKLITAIREMEENFSPNKVYGCEVWRDLDWLNDDEKVVFDVSANPKLNNDLLKVFDSQIAGGKRYDLATEGRRIANATFSASHSVDNAKQVVYAIDLTPLCKNKNLSILDYATGAIDRFKKDVADKINKVLQ